MKEYGYIQGTHHRNVFGEIERIDYEWIGSRIAQLQYPLGVYNLDCEMDGNNVKIGPYRAYVISREFYGYLIIRKDGLWKILVIWHRINRVLDIAYRRFIVTLALWGLAEYSNGYVPNINDIYLVKKIKRLFKHK